MKICDYESCTGCMACMNICAVSAISMAQDAEGFLRPSVDEKICVQCGKCARICPQNHKRDTQADTNSKKVYAAWQRETGILRQSTSGGAFTALATVALSKGGVVYGVGFSDDMMAVHKRITDLSGLDELRGSKYVQSSINTSLRMVQEDLNSGKQVLFSGTPCQIDGLYAFLGKRFEQQLCTIDIVCHGVPSPMVYRDYLDYMIGKYHSKPVSVQFRNKEPGWFVFGMRIVFENGKEYKADTYTDPYIRGFLRELFLRPSCHDCKYANLNRPADITLADFWGYHDSNRADRDHDQGISMVMLNTTVGAQLFQEARSQLKVFDRPLQEAVNGNQALRACFPPSEKRADFWKDYGTLSFEDLIGRYMYPEEAPDWVKTRDERQKQLHHEQDMFNLKHFPQIMVRSAVGRERYDQLKKRLKKQ